MADADYSLVYRTTCSVTVGDGAIVSDGSGAYHKDITVPAQNIGTAFIRQACRERRIGDEYGATVEFLNATTLRLKWYGTLVNDESTGLDEIISVPVEIYDLNDVLVEVNELLFRSLRTLALLGENCLNDLLEYDAAGNVVQYRLRAFDSRTNAEDATPDLPQGQAMETGELCRIIMSQDIVMSKNDRALMTRVLTDVLDTPGNT